MKNLIILFVALFAIFCAFSFFGALGFAQGGGNVEIFSKTVTATGGDNSQVIAAWNAENINAQHTPVQPTLPTNDGTWTYGIATAVLFAVVYFSFKHFTSLSYKSDDNDDWQPEYEKQPNGERKYG